MPRWPKDFLLERAGSITYLLGVTLAPLCGCFLALLTVNGAERYDLLIRSGRLVDGTGNPAYFADVAVKEGRIVAIEEISANATAETVIDAEGMIVAPGFIDVHTHADEIADSSEAQNFLRMGVTTVVVGNCGGSKLEAGRFFDGIEQKHISINAATLIGHNTVRERAMGGDFDRPASPDEMETEPDQFRWNISMKKMLWWSLAILVIVGLALGGCKVTRSGYESAPYRVVRADGKFQVRDYPELTVMETAMTGSPNGDDGSFMRLFRFIAGGNEAKQTIAMTTPVFMSGGETNATMAFVLPAKMRAGEVPKPLDGSVDSARVVGGAVRGPGATNRGTADPRVRKNQAGRLWPGGWTIGGSITNSVSPRLLP